jgi:hypothetical protein
MCCSSGERVFNYIQAAITFTEIRGLEFDYTRLEGIHKG